MKTNLTADGLPQLGVARRLAVTDEDRARVAAKLAATPAGTPYAAYLAARLGDPPTAQPLPKDRLRDIAFAADAASDGPWEADGWEIYGPGREWIAVPCAPAGRDYSQSAANGRFIALARTAIPELLAEIAWLKGGAL